MANKKEVNFMLLGIVAIMAIVGLVLLFTSPAATGNAYRLPPLPTEVAYPAGAGIDVGGQLPGTPVLSPIGGHPCGAAPICPNGKLRTFMQKNVKVTGERCGVCTCPGSEVGSGYMWACY